MRLHSIWRLSDIVYLTGWIFIATAISNVAADRSKAGGVGFQSVQMGDQIGYQDKYVCDGDLFQLSCPVGSDTKIHVKSAHYKIAPQQLCKKPPKGQPETLCSSKTQDHIERMCNNKTKCQIPVVNRDVFVSSCHQEASAYLIVNYACLPMPKPIIDPDGQGTTARYADGKTCPMIMRKGILWPETYAGDTGMGTCPNNQQAVGTWQCGRDPVRWVGTPNLQNCMSLILNQLRAEVLSQKSADSINRTTYQSLTSRMLTYSERDLAYGGDVPVLADIMHELVIQLNDTVKQSEEAKDVIKDVTGAILRTSSNLLREEIWSDLPRDTWSSNATRILSTVESSAFQLAGINQTSINVTDNIVLQVEVLDSSRVDDLVLPRRSGLEQDTRWRFTSTSVHISKQTLLELSQKGKASVVFAMYKNVAGLMPPYSQSETTSEQAESACSLYSNCSTSSDRFVNSDVITASVGSEHSATRGRVNIKNEVFFTLQHYNVENATNPTCAFWNYSDVTGRWDWSTDGCRLVETNSTHTTCACSHLTNFAIIMSPTQPQISAAHEFALSVITYFGCIISLICLLLAFITFVAFKNLQCDRTTIHKNLCLTLFIANFVFLVGIMQYNVPVFCSIVAATLHYFFLAAFGWMCLEGVQLYVMLVEVFEAEKSRVRWYYLGAYGCPAIIVIISAAVYHQGYGTDNHCWLSTERGFVWAFIAPAICILLANSFMLGIAIRAMIQHAKSSAALRMKEKTKLEQIRLWLKGTIVLVFLLGLTWLFGLMYVSASTVVFAYIFAILNSLQGLFIFIFHCLMNDKVMTEYRKFIRRSTWLPESFRNRYGEKSKSTAYSNTGNNRDTGSTGKVNLLGNQNRKSSEVTTLSKSTSNAKSGSSVNPDRETPALVHSVVAVDSGIDDPSSYTEVPSPEAATTHHVEHELNGKTAAADDDDVTDDSVSSPREPSTADYLETIKDRRRIAESLAARHSTVDSEQNSGVQVAGSTGGSAEHRTGAERYVSGSSDEDDEDFSQGPERSLVKRKVDRLSSVTAV